MRIAIIDLGTNTFNILIVDYSIGAKSFTKVFNTRISVKLGEGTINSGYISDASFKRGIDALKKYKEYINHYQVADTYALATSAIRSASNGHAFVAEAKKETDIDITIIDGDKEAELIYYGSRMAVNMPVNYSLIMDIGGGSTEFIIANNEGIVWKKSFLLGAARLLEKFQPSDPITSKEIDNLNLFLTSELTSLVEAVNSYKPTELIGSSGAFDSIVDVVAGMYNTIGLQEGKTEHVVNISDYRKMSQLIINSTIKERQQIKGLLEMRVDMIVISCLLIDFILNTFNLEKIRASTYSLKEGALFEFINKTI